MSYYILTIHKIQEEEGGRHHWGWLFQLFRLSRKTSKSWNTTAADFSNFSDFHNTKLGEVCDIRARKVGKVRRVSPSRTWILGSFCPLPVLSPLLPSFSSCFPLSLSLSLWQRGGSRGRQKQREERKRYRERERAKERERDKERGREAERQGEG